MINFFNAHFSRGHLIAAFLIIATIAALIAVNAYCLEITQGHYNAIDILFL